MRIDLRKKGLKQKKALKTLDFLNLIMILKLRIEKSAPHRPENKNTTEYPLNWKKRAGIKCPALFF